MNDDVRLCTGDTELYTIQRGFPVILYENQQTTRERWRTMTVSNCYMFYFASLRPKYGLF